jgi:hypothetical protein
MRHLITEDEFLEQVRSFGRTAFHFEAQPAYAIGIEQADLERFLVGDPVQPTDSDLLRPWLERVAHLRAEGKRIGRVRVLEEPPTDYQRWLLWATPCNVAVGEDILYIPRSKAERIGLPLDHDWWLLDGERVLITWFTADGEIREKVFTDEPGDVVRHRAWRDLAVAHSGGAEHVTAA